MDAEILAGADDIARGGTIPRATSLRRMTVTVLHHPEAGEGEWPEGRVKAFLAAAGIHGRYCSWMNDDVDEAMRSARGVVIVAGGDATVARAAVLVDRAHAWLAIMPTGGANNIARCLGAYAPPERITEVLKANRSIEFPIGQMRAAHRTICFVEAAGVGALTQSMQTIEHGLPRTRKRAVGRDALRKALLVSAPIRASAVLDGCEVTEPLLVIEMMNIEQIGPGLRLAAPRQADGRFSAVWLPVAARDAMLDWIDRPEQGPPPVEETRVRCASIRLNGEQLRLDDTVQSDLPDQVELSLQDQPIRILLPGAEHDVAADR